MKLAKLIGDSIVELCEDNIVVKDFAYAKLNSVGREEKDDAFHVCDLGDVVKKWKKWNEVLPHVQPFYGELICSGEIQAGCRRLSEILNFLFNWF